MLAYLDRLRKADGRLATRSIVAVDRVPVLQECIANHIQALGRRNVICSNSGQAVRGGPVEEGSEGVVAQEGGEVRCDLAEVEVLLRE